MCFLVQYNLLLFTQTNHLMQKQIVFLIALLSTAAAFAQQGLELGVQVMPQVSFIVNDDDFAAGDDLNFRSTTSLAFGALAGYNFTDNLGVQTGVLYSRQGQKYVDDNPTPANSNSEVRLTYLKIPLLLKFNSNPDAGTQFVASVGPQFGLLSSVKYFANDDEIDITGISGGLIDPKDAYKSMDLAAVFSIGTRFRLSEQLRLGAALRLDYSLGDIEDKENILWANDRASSHNALGGIMIDLVYALGQ